MDTHVLNALLSMQNKIKTSEQSMHELHNTADEMAKSIKEEINKLHAKNEELRQSNMKLKEEIIELQARCCEHDESSACILCFEQRRNVLFRPCNHLLICDNCSGKTSFHECIVCKHPIDSYEYAYL